MTIYTRAQWLRFRDNHKDTPGKGAVSRVSLGDLIDAANKSLTKDDMKKEFKSKWLDEFTKTMTSTIAILKPAEALKANIMKAAPLFDAINGSSTATD